MVSIRLFLGLFCLTYAAVHAAVVSPSRHIIPPSNDQIPALSRTVLNTKYARGAETLIDAIVGSYENFKYTGSGKNNWHYVTISKVDSSTLRRKNRADVKWTLTLKPKDDGFDPTALAVGTDCPYYKSGYTEAAITWNADKNSVTAVAGFANEPYTRVYTADEVVQSVVGTYENMKYSGSQKNNWHYVTISKVDSTTLKWTNRAKVSWTLSLIAKDSGYDPDKLSVGTDCPYYKSGHTEATIVRDANSNVVSAIRGPVNEPYTRVYSASEIADALVGTYENLKYSGTSKSNWHFVTISKVDDTTLTWKNRAGVSWTLKLNSKDSGCDGDTFGVGSNSPYYKTGHTEGEITWNHKHTSVVAVTGPGNEIYSRM